jgi:fengycin family lipopeptide synthetase D
MQELIMDKKITTAFFVPSMLAMLLDHLELTNEIVSLGTIKYMFTCGEALGPKLCKRFVHMSSSTLVNLYGPTEADITWWEYPRYDNNVTKIPIGKPTTNVKVYVLDDQLKPVPIGVPG